ncbi:hypothetical protein WR25_02414 [Diploscapter pachys]|uniref:Endonuclease/exonuclease/phosphatase domain-containing protein n=1 Tax=Diploscapter pachys TaxID=2018661 RepID=A0A2A2JNM8_9BILA|nr:hypothetical protein WR25_02414 [Diploscapter pachys]
MDSFDSKTRQNVDPFNGLNYESYLALRKNVRDWENLGESGQGKDEKISLVCYNILCPETFKRCLYLYDHLVHTGLLHFASWSKRFKSLVEELKSFNADIICMQEVHMNCYSDFENSLKYAYDGIYRKKNFSYCHDGCAIFYRKDRFKKVFYEDVEFVVKGNKYLDYPHIGQVLVLKSRKTGGKFIVANTHLIFRSEKGDIRLGQAVRLLASVHRLIQEKKYPKDIPFIFCGDCNSEPNSGFYRFMADSRLNIDRLTSDEVSNYDTPGNKLVDMRTIVPPQLDITRRSIYRTFDRAESPVDRQLVTHPFHFKSVYDESINDNSKVGISTYHLRSGHPDFIFYSNSIENEAKSGTSSDSDDDIQVVYDSTQNYQPMQIVPIRRLGLPSLGNLSKLEKWPNEWVPSDHIPLVVEFELRKITGNEQNGSTAGSSNAKI